MTKQEGKAGGRTRVSRGAAPHHDAALATDLARNAHARERYELVWRCGFGLILALAASVVGNVYLGTRPPVVETFAITPDGAIRKIETLNEPLANESTVLNWTTTAITAAFTMSFANQAQELEDVRPYFTDTGWTGYQAALERSGFLSNLVKNQYVATAVPSAAPTIVAQGLVGDDWAWRVQIPVIVTYTSNTSSSQNLTVEVTVVRRPASEAASGLGIAQIVSR